ncbi:MAG: HlyC/CorC family transporter, partial [Chloroflexi bacterium]|nr:HlyC/CorC family transporter [Chloroflexota bacterium]
MGSTLLNIAIVLGLILLEALFVASEIALVSLREGQVRAIAERGRRGAAVARLIADPNRFLATVQIGVTVTALLSSAFGAVTLSDEAGRALMHAGMSKGPATVIGFIGITVLISFVTLVIGELVPKRLALQRSEATAVVFSPTLDRLATIARPVIWLLSRCTDALVRVFGGDPATGREAISEEELRGLVAAHESLTSDERRLIDEVFAAGERSVSEVMVPRTEVVFLKASMPVAEAARVAAESPHSRYPVIGESQDDVRGFAHIRDLYLHPPHVIGTGAPGTVGALTREVKRLPGSKNVLAALSEMRREA